MLKINKNITLTGNSVIDGKPAVYMNASISTSGENSTKNTSIQDKTLYDANKEACRKDMQEFENTVYEIEDSMNTGGMEDAE